MDEIIAPPGRYALEMCQECQRLGKDVHAALAELQRSIQSPREIARAKMLDAAMAFQEHSRVCDESKRKRELEFLSTLYRIGDEDLKRQVMEQMKALMRSERAP